MLGGRGIGWRYLVLGLGLEAAEDGRLVGEGIERHGWLPLQSVRDGDRGFGGGVVLGAGCVLEGRSGRQDGGWWRLASGWGRGGSISEGIRCLEGGRLGEDDASSSSAPRVAAPPRRRLASAARAE